MLVLLDNCLVNLKVVFYATNTCTKLQSHGLPLQRGKESTMCKHGQIYSGGGGGLNPLESL